MNQAFSLGVLDAIFYESLSRYRPDSKYRDIAVSECGGGYTARSTGFWTSMTPDGHKLQEAGWKIHISALPEFAEETLKRVLPILSINKTPFKFCSDEKMLRMSLNKNWPRKQSGKFITVYPKDEEKFRRLAEALSQVLRGLIAPRILSDRQYSKDAPVYYRFGEHLGSARRNDQGHLQSGYHINGVFVHDERGIYAPTPPGMKDPFGQDATRVAPAEIILNGKYKVVGALKFSALGGIYIAESSDDPSGVVIREARSLMGYGKHAASTTPFFVIEKEAQLLRKLNGLGVTPNFVDFFIEDGHAFLVQEKIEGESFWARSVAIMLNDKLSTTGDAWNALVELFTDLAEGLYVVHSQSVVLRDLTRTNVIITPDDGVRFIDLEFAHDCSKVGENWLNGFTPGYASNEQRQGKEPSVAEDYYAYGALLVEMLTMCATGLELNPNGVMLKLEQNVLDLGFPEEVVHIASRLLIQDPEARSSPLEASAELQLLSPPDRNARIPHYDDRSPLRGGGLLDNREIDKALDGIDLFFENYVDFDRKDRLWPVSAQGLSVHPGALDHGALGPAFYLHARDKLSNEVVDWIGKAFEADHPPAGLMSGFAGLAVFYGAICEKAKALAALERAIQRLPQSAGLFYGAAGVGLAALQLYARFDDAVFLRHARTVTDVILARVRSIEEKIWWPDDDGAAPIGLGQGSSGIGLFLLYFGALTSSSKIIQLARAALQHDINHRVTLSGYTLFKPRTNSTSTDPNSPHLLYGSAGVGAVAARFLKVSPGDESLREVVQSCSFATRQRLTNKLWQYHGLAGTGEYALDLLQFGLSEDPALPRWLAEGILPLSYEMDNGGTAFPGDALIKICGDYAMGTAGIGIFMNRLRTSRGRFLFMDDLLD